MEQHAWRSIAFYSVFAILVYYQRVHAQQCERPPVLRLLLTGMALLGILTGFIYLVTYGWAVAWWGALVPLATSVLAAIPGNLLERLVGRETLGWVAVPGWPVCAYLMFQTLPV